VFCASLADVFDNQVDATWRADLFELIRGCDQLDWLLLTKRPQNIRKMLPTDWGTGYANVWLGTTAEDADAYQQRVSHLLALPAAVRFVSYEPALGPLGPISISGRVPDWIIIGGEAGSGRTSCAERIHSGREMRSLNAVAKTLRHFLNNGAPTPIILWWSKRGTRLNTQCKVIRPKMERAEENWMESCAGNFRRFKIFQHW